MKNRQSWTMLLRRLRWDLMDPKERPYYGYWLIWQIPGPFGVGLRARYLAPRLRSAGKNLQVLAGCRFRSMELLEVGDNVAIGYDNFLQALGGLTIGNNVTTAPGVKIWSVNHNVDDPEAAVVHQGQSHKPVIIGDNVFIGSNAFILPGVALPEGCIVSAGAVVSAKEYKPFSILAGNPARVIGFRGARRSNAQEPTAAPVDAA
ncbi:MAG TPA: acyltransferase [Steroidobacter sp.]|jgi:acetyltransferase-like isoleucine patch superfamily enzyme|nr:acyltransferase [Steroidobacter sp.]